MFIVSIYKYLVFLRNQISVLFFSESFVFKEKEGFSQFSLLDVEILKQLVNFTYSIQIVTCITQIIM